MKRPELRDNPERYRDISYYVYDMNLYANLLEAVVKAARELRQSWREDGDGSAQESGALKKFHEALDALED